MSDHPDLYINQRCVETLTELARQIMQCNRKQSDALIGEVSTGATAPVWNRGISRSRKKKVGSSCGPENAKNRARRKRGRGKERQKARESSSWAVDSEGVVLLEYWTVENTRGLEQCTGKTLVHPLPSARCCSLFELSAGRRRESDGRRLKKSKRVDGDQYL